jgi:hypothetical protein
MKAKLLLIEKRKFNYIVLGLILLTVIIGVVDRLL